MSPFWTFFFLNVLCSEGRIVKFWHVTDFHYDWLYDQYGNVAKECHAYSDNNSNHPNIGKYGNYMCDSPRALILTSISAMKSLEPDPDFIIWTGDSVPHIQQTEYNTSDVISDMNFVATQLAQSFDVAVMPVHGNHDYWPSNQQPDTENAIYDAAFETWKKWIGPEYKDQLTTAGYYKSKFSFDNKIHHFLCLNTNLYYTSDKVNFSNPQDPGNQLQFMKDHFKNVGQNDITHIVAHIYPGAFERNADYVWFTSNFNKQYNDIILDNSDKIGFQLYGHGHTDSFKVFKDSNGNAKATALLAPAVTPWYSSLQGAGANNPGVRLMYLDSDSGQITDYVQYWMNLTEANQSNEPKFKKLYQFSELYLGNTQQPVLNANALNSVLQNLKSNDTLFQQYYQYNSVNYDFNKCTGNCKASQLCAIEYVDIDDLNECLKENANDAMGLDSSFLLSLLPFLLVTL